MNNPQNSYRISVIIPTFRRFDYLQTSLVSALSQDFDSFEIIVADDGSPNFPQRTIESLIDSNNDKLINVKIIHLPTNKGTVFSLNNAIMHSEGEIIVILAFDDCFVDSSVLSKISNEFSIKKCDILFCRRMECDEDLNPVGQLIPNNSELNSINKKLTNSNTIFRRRIMMRDFNFGSGSAMYFLKSFFIDAGQYDTRYKLWEDGPFIAKVMRNGCNYCLDYNIVSIKYRNGGISSSNEPPKAILDDYINYFNFEYEPFKKSFSFAQRKYVKQVRKRFENRLKGRKNGLCLRIKAKIYYFLAEIGL